MMRGFFWVLVATLLALPVIGSRPSEQVGNADLSWAYAAPDKIQPQPLVDDGAAVQVPGSAKTYLRGQLHDLALLKTPPDWFPEEHPVMPGVVQHGDGKAVLACASCHLASGLGHPESADLTGLSVPYMLHQLADFKGGARNARPMLASATNMTDEDAKAACEWFAALPMKSWVKVVETDRVPKTYINTDHERLPLPAGGTEPLGNRIIELPEDPARSIARDPHSGFVAYVPNGSIARGEMIVTTGNEGKIIACGTCHGQLLEGMGDVPRIAGRSPVYIFRQLHDVQTGDRAGSAIKVMKGTVAHLSNDDMIAIAAYAASLGQ
jgi:cytochrome c553